MGSEGSLGGPRLKLVVDTFAFVEIFRGTAEGKWAATQIELASEVFTVDFVLAELARKFRREAVDRSESARRLDFVETHFSVLAIDGDLAASAADVWMEMVEGSRRFRGRRSPGLADAVLAAAARRVGGKVLSGDPHFRLVPEGYWIAP